MKIPIKFRGRDVETGEYVYGDFINGALGTLINEHQWAMPARIVEPSSVAQLLGYDKNGDEVYEGDILEFDFEDLQKRGEMMHYEYVAHMKGFATTADGCYIPREKFKELQSRKRQGENNG